MTDGLDLNKYIAQQLEDIDISLIVKQEVKSQVQGDVARELKVIVREQIERIILDEIDLVMKEGIEVSDGWDKPKRYEKFSDFFRVEFRKRLDKSYDIRKLIDKAVKDKVSSLFNANIDKALKDIVEKLTKEMVECTKK